MKSSKDNSPKRSSSKLFLIGGAVVLVALIAWWVSSLSSPKSNHAESTAKPFEAALVQAGAVKKCSAGDAGFGPDNKKPFYNATFETGLDKEGAIKLAQEVASGQGYKLEFHQSPYDYIFWYSDDSSKQSSYSDLKNGAVGLSMNVYSGGDNLSCNGSNVVYDKDHAAIVLSVGLPERK